MSQENVEVVRRAVAAINDRDLDGYLACCSEHVELRTPLIVGVYEGRKGIQRYFSDVEDAAPDFRIDINRVETVGPDQVLAFIRTRGTGRATGIPLGFEATNVYDLVDGQITRVRIFLDASEALKAVGLAE
jgi:ketosteroid isomerase-like protein